ncbi:MAG: hypothetical protein ACRDDY_02470 [Clostridium sp.]|uniref:hypothetical protein n=1 Tax=Clostridium sp. TaxID=1506 RepID=UPI003EE466A1
MNNVILGVNDLNTTHPHLIKFFESKEDSKKFSYGSSKKASLICPNCGLGKNMVVHKLATRGFSCAICKETIPLGERIVASVLKESNVEFETQKEFDWSKKRRYDFYIKEFDCIIETHGAQHYKGSCFEHMSGGRTFEVESNNDLFKESVARKNGIKHYVVIDTRKGTIDETISNLKKSELCNFIKFEELCWSNIFENISTSTISKICKRYMELGDKSTTTLMKEFKLGREAIIKHLKNGEAMGLCDYSNNIIVGGKTGRKTKPLKVLELDKTFTSMANLCRFFKEELGVHVNDDMIRTNIKRGTKYKGYTFYYL